MLLGPLAELLNICSLSNPIRVVGSTSMITRPGESRWLTNAACFASLPTAHAELPETDRACAEVLSLPIFPTMTRREQQTVVVRIAEYFAKVAEPSVPTPHVTSPVLDGSLQSL